MYHEILCQYNLAHPKIYIAKMERDAVRPFNPIFHHRCVDDIYNSRKINKKYDLYGAVNKYDKILS